MADKVIDRFFIALGLDTKDVEKGINDTVTTVKGGLKNLLVGAVMPALGALATGELVQQFTAEITQVDRLSKSLGMNIEQLQAWRGAAEMAGVEADEVSELFADLNDWMVDAAQNQSGAMYEYIEKGWLPAVQKANGEMKSTEQYALELADALKALGEQQGSGVARQIGISNANMAAFLQRGSGDISKSIAQAKELGVYTAEDAKAAREFDVSIKSLSHSLRMLLLPIFRVLAPAATMFTNLLREATKHGTALIPVLTAVSALLATIAYKHMAVLAKQALAFIFSPWGVLLTALVGIGLILEDFVVWLDGGESAFGEFYDEVFGGAEEAKKWLNDLLVTIGEIWEFIKDNGAVIAKVMALVWAIYAIATAIQAVMTIVSILAPIFAAATGPIGILILALIAIIYELIANWEYWKDVFAECVDYAETKWNDFLALIQSGVDWINEKVNWVLEKIDSIPDLPSLSDIGGMIGFGSNSDNSLATPATAGTTNNTSNHETNIDGKVNITIQGNADREAIQQAQEQSSDFFGGAVSQANASQALI